MPPPFSPSDKFSITEAVVGDVGACTNAAGGDATEASDVTPGNAAATDEAATAAAANTDGADAAGDGFETGVVSMSAEEEKNFVLVNENEGAFSDFEDPNAAKDDTLETKLL